MRIFLISIVVSYLNLILIKIYYMDKVEVYRKDDEVKWDNFVLNLLLYLSVFVFSTPMIINYERVLKEIQEKKVETIGLVLLEFVIWVLLDKLVICKEWGKIRKIKKYQNKKLEIRYQIKEIDNKIMFERDTEYKETLKRSKEMLEKSLTAIDKAILSQELKGAFHGLEEVIETSETKDLEKIVDTLESYEKLS